jgi:hypothetical protein
MAREVVFCKHCGQQRKWDIPSIRITKDACEICGGWDIIRTRKLHPRTGEAIIKTVHLDNFIQRADMLPNTPEENRLQEPIK